MTTTTNPQTMSTLKKYSPFLLSLAIASSASAVSVPVFTDNFDSDTPGPTPLFDAILGVAPPTGWAGDQAQIVSSASGPLDGVSAHSSPQMLQFLNTNYAVTQNSDGSYINPPTEGSNSDLYYVVDLSEFDTSLGLTGNESPTVTLSAWFNTGSLGIPEDYEYFLGLLALDHPVDVFNNIKNEAIEDSPTYATNYGATPGGENFGGRLADDDNTGDWQQVTISLDLPDDTRYLAMRLGLHQTKNTGTDIQSAFVDDITLSIELPGGFEENPSVDPNPVPASGSTFAFLGIALAGLTATGARKKQRA